MVEEARRGKETGSGVDLWVSSIFVFLWIKTSPVLVIYLPRESPCIFPTFGNLREFN